MPSPSLRFATPDFVDIRSWSYGRVDTLENLYEPRIFGPEHDFQCSCGKYHGESMIGIICDECGVKLVADAAKVRRERLAHIVLPRSCPHPLDESASISEFPVAPIGFRTTADGVNALGRKYEDLVRTVSALQQSLPPFNPSDEFELDKAREYYRALGSLDVSEVASLMREIVGVSQPPAPPSIDDDTILGLLFQAITKLDPTIHTLIHSCACVVEVSTSL